MEGVAYQRRSHNKYHLSLGHAWAQLIDHLLSDDVALWDRNFIHAGKVHGTDVATGQQQGHERKQKAVSNYLFHRLVVDSVFTESLCK